MILLAIAIYALFPMAYYARPRTAGRGLAAGCFYLAPRCRLSRHD